MLFQKIISIVTLTSALMEGSLGVAMPDKDVHGTAFLVNRQHTINEDYIPQVRKTDLYGMSQSMRPDAATALEELFATAKEESDVSLSTVSGYRGYSKQATIYSRKKKTAGVDKADSLVAMPGTSEHQLGLVMDVAQKGRSQLNSGFGKTKSGQWVRENAHRFGFIVRYQEGYEEITGYSYEPWHLRYVGKQYAQAIFEASVPMEIFMSQHRLDVYEYLIQATNNEVYP